VTDRDPDTVDLIVGKTDRELNQIWPCQTK
jgi:hypothetical protein